MGQNNSDKKPSRYDFAKVTYGEKLFAWSRQDEIGQAMGDDIDSVFAKIVTYDPTKEKESRFKFLSWICKVVIEENIKPEDVYKIRDNLKTFMSIQDDIPKDKRDINQLLTAGDLDALVAPYQVKFKENKTIRQQINEETTFLYNGKLGKILIPKTMRSAQFWGQGTKWCISAEEEKDNAFESYNKDGPIVIIILNEADKKNGRSYQTKFAGHKRDRKLRNTRDEEVDYQLPLAVQQMLLQSGQLNFCMQHCLKPTHFLRKTFDEAAINELLSIYVHPLHFFEGELNTNNWLFAIRYQIPHMIMNVPPSLLSMEICLEAVRKNFSVIQLIDRNLPYFEEVRKAAFETYQIYTDDADYKKSYRPFFADLIAKKEENLKTKKSLKMKP